MAWYDFLSADDEKKDEYGMTQYDRQQPVWSGLIKAGLLGVAGGQDLAPAQRASLIAQMGGAISEIPEQQRAARAAEAQNMLRGQQVKAGKMKIAQQEKLAAYAKTPEFATAMEKLDPSRKMLVQAALDAGDIDAAVKVLHNADTATLQSQGLDVRRRNAETAEAALAARTANDAERRRLEEERLELARQKKAEAEGQMTPAKAWAIVNKAAAIKDPNDPIFASPEYRHAITLLSKPTITTDVTGQKTEISGEDFSHMPPPTFNMTGEPPKPRTPTILPGQPKKPLDNKAIDTISTNLGQLNKVEGVTKEIIDNPDIQIGDAVHQILSRVPGDAGIDLLNKADPKGANVRAFIADIGSQIVHDRSGAAVTIAEYPRLAPFIPKITDSREVIIQKLNKLQKELDLDLQLRYKNIGEGSIVPDPLEARYGKKKGGGSGGKRTVRQWNAAKNQFEDVEVD